MFHLRDVSAGYDIKSFKIDGQIKEIYIEVLSRDKD
jgi:hypothetical protein